ncbi:MAG: cyclohexanecarboxylate-CoA ligase [Gammaproteobacteria bacterium]|nr:cyclohexanecarboxylate-CoA ligase [Gammaproteobacteria bacterium]
MRDVSGWDIRLNPEEAQALRSAGIWRNRTIAQDARERAVLEPHRICISDPYRAVTFGEILQEAEWVAVSLWSLGLRPGDVISFQLPNWIEAAAINLAASLLGLVVNPIVPIYRESETTAIVRDCRAKVLFVPDTFRRFDHLGMAERVRAASPTLQHVVVVKPPAGFAREGVLTYETLLDSNPAGFAWPEICPDAVKFVLYTSGTTGVAKGVLHTHETISRVLRGCMEFWGIEAGDGILMPSPVTHITGYLWGLEAPFLRGTPTVLMERWSPDEAVEVIDRIKLTMTISATTFLQELLDAAERAGSRLPSLKVFACGGASVPPGLIRRANALFERGRAFRVYGATEVPMIGRGCVDPRVAAPAADTDGMIVDFEVRFIDEHGREVEEGAEGEIIARGPGQCVGYVDAGATHASFDTAGFFHTGDLGRRTADGAIVITGRKKDLIIRGGENISAKEIEDILINHPGIREIAVVAMPHCRLGETVCAFVIVGERRPSLVDLVSHLETAGIARQKFPERLEIVDEMPRTAAGKIKKDVLRGIAASLVKDAVAQPARR